MMSTREKNRNVKGGGRVKKLLAAVLCAIFAAGVVLLAVFHAKIGTAAAERLILSEKYTQAQRVISVFGEESGGKLGEYAALRKEIKEKYPAVAEEYDEELINKWKETAQSLAYGGGIKNGAVKNEAASLSVKLNFICTAAREYEELRPVVLHFMDVFSEYNRLHLRRGETNISFTPAEINIKLAGWEAELDAVSRYACTLPEYEGIYLLSYMLKEGRSEITALQEDMNKVLAGGYDENDVIRYGDDRGRTFPSVNNKDGVSFNLAGKEQYERQMASEIKKHLVQSSLLSFY